MKRFILSILLSGALVLPGKVALAQQRIEQPVTIDGQEVQGVTVVQDGAVQTFTCPDPQQYNAIDQSSSGYACFDQATGTWLLHAQPQQSVGGYVGPPAYYPEAPAYTYSPYVYPYAYPYGYAPYYGGPLYSFGFGWGHGHGFYGEHGRSDGGFRGGRSFGGHGSFGHGGGHGGRR